ncbi:class I SAM-dependent methyltransferase [Actinomadura rudentiformis]|uniref:Class I SAM-dependent methyltransferase n=1 Tax=Actinomadura rudentiformis TaxID=359158 RepID=A0A6H9YLL7_9ACTN|nr:class I SAM-dependent methyltransferase [Actinomadura rudentiformis]KAB2345558.1 class I SAM-dependent methyltransferase [Actinomadura rudentiformis]
MSDRPIYESFAAEYADHAVDSPYNAFYDRPAVLGLAGDVSGLTVLDAACGPGLYAAELRRRGARVIAFDQSPTLVELARERLGTDGDLRVHDLAEPLSWVDDGSVDLVVLALALHYVDDRVAMLREFRRVLRPGGVVVLSTHHPIADWQEFGGSYFTVGAVEVSLSSKNDWPVRVWRRPLTAMFAEFRAAGFLVDELLEPRPDAEMATRYPDDYAELEEAPAFIAFRLVPDPASSSP